MKLELENDFEVGQIVFFIASKTESVIPALVAEKIVRTKIDGEQVGYVLHIKTSKGLEKVEVSPIKTKLYSSLVDVREHMMEVASFAIDKLIQVASEAASEISGTVKRPASSSKSLPGNSTDEEIAEVMLDDGRVAKIRMS